MAGQTSSLVRKIPTRERKVFQSIMKRCRHDLSREEHFRYIKKQQTAESDENSAKSWYQVMVENAKDRDSSTDEEAVAMALASMYSWDLLERGLVRRILNDDPSELGRALSLEARFDWLHSYQRGQPANERYPDVWKILHGLAASDIEVARAYFHGQPRQLRGGHKTTVLAYNAVQAITSQSHRSQLRLASDSMIEYPDGPDHMRAVLRTLFGILIADAEIVAVELERVVATFRRFQFHDHEMIISIIAHGLAELAYWVSPKLLAEFDVEQPFPWDREYYRWLRTGNRSVKYRDMSKHSAILHRWIYDLEQPGWWHRRRK